MSCLPRAWIAVLCLAPLACVAYDKPAATEGPSETPPVVAPSEAQQPVTETPSPVTQSEAPMPTQSEVPKGELLVQALPAGVVGIELREGRLHVREGYALVQGAGGTMSLVDPDNREKPSGLGCGCSGGTGGCVVANQGGILVCKDEGCTGSCGLAVTIDGITTEILRF